MIIPGNINLEFDELCKNCFNSSLAMEEHRMFTYNIEETKLYTITCEHAKACKRWKKYYNQLVNKNNDRTKQNI